jgi:hypothetical protein
VFFCSKWQYFGHFEAISNLSRAPESEQINYEEHREDVSYDFDSTPQSNHLLNVGWPGALVLCKHGFIIAAVVLKKIIKKN